MKIVADEGIDRQVVERLRRESHEVIYVAELAPGINDDGVLQLANERDVLLNTEIPWTPYLTNNTLTSILL